ncbi:MAG: cobalt transporter CbiM [Chloroflexota bacterium]
MHIPDGYLSPLISLGAGVATVPAWGLATQRVQKVLDNRTIPLLAIFSALSFTIMMFNIPVPGGTTAHGVGAGLIAIVLGPWAAVISVSVALVIQALFFGDGGVLAILINCFNMGIAIPFVAYWIYRLVAARAPLLSTRRVTAAFIGGYAGMTVSALLVGIELGVQPLLFTGADGIALYSPYGLAEAIPAMLVSHVFGASIVEGLIGALGVAYFQKRHPEYLTSLKSVFASDDAEEGVASPRPLWQIASVITVTGIGVIVVLGLVLGGGDPAHMFGADWSRVDWPAVASMLLVVAGLFVILVPLAFLLLPRRWRKVGAGFAALAVIAPRGLIAPGFAYGEGSTEDVRAAFGYVPKGLQDLSGVFSAPLSGYNLPLPFFADANSALWHAAVGYEVTGILGMLLTGGAVLLVSRLLMRRAPAAATTDRVAAPRPSGGSGRPGWIENTLGGIAANIERAVFTEQHARLDAFLQRVDPRAKLGMFLVVVLAASLTGSYAILAVLYCVTLAAAAASRIPGGFFVKRVWAGIPLFAGIVVIPSIFFIPGPRLFELALGPLVIAPSLNGTLGALLLVMRVGVSVSLAVLLVMTTPWADILKSLRALRVPQVFVLILSMTYRYIFLFLHTVNGIFLARKSRIVARTTGGEQRRWIGGTMGALMSRSFKMSNDVYAAMLARGFSGEMRAYSAYRMTTRDWLLLGGSLAMVVVLLGIEGMWLR